MGPMRKRGGVRVCVPSKGFHTETAVFTAMARQKTCLKARLRERVSLEPLLRNLFFHPNQMIPNPFIFIHLTSSPGVVFATCFQTLLPLLKKGGEGSSPEVHHIT